MGLKSEFQPSNHILIVDDVPDNTRILFRILHDMNCEVSVAQNGIQAMALIKQQQPDLILLDVLMPGVDGFELCARLKAVDETQDIPIIFVTALSDVESKLKGFNLGGVDYVTKPIQYEELVARVTTHLKLRDLTKGLEKKVYERTSELAQAYDTTIAGWARALEMRDDVTEGHSQRVMLMSVRLAQKMGMGEETLVHIQRGALLHDVGKMGVPDRILRKSGSLSAEERRIMEQHPQFAYDMLKGIEFLRPALDIPRYHHEWWDGSGYNEGLQGEAIPLAARIFAVVDVWDALVMDRPYRKAWEPEKALAYIQGRSGTQFDPAVVAAFMEMIGEQVD